MSERTGLRDQPITGRFCPACGYDMTGHELSARMTCPECGLDLWIQDLWTRRPRGWIDRSFVRFCNSQYCPPATLIFGIVILLLAFVRMFQSDDEQQYAALINAQPPLRNVSSAILAFASDNGDRVPSHPVQLIADGWVSPDSFIDGRLPPDCQQTRFGSVSLRDPFHGTAEQIASLAAAMKLEDSDASYYQLGDYNFARWPERWKLSECRPPEHLILVWTKVYVGGTRSVAFADGHVMELNEDEWAAAWRRDSAERVRLGIPVISADVVRRAGD